MVTDWGTFSSIRCAVARDLFGWNFNKSLQIVLDKQVQKSANLKKSIFETLCYFQQQKLQKFQHLFHVIALVEIFRNRAKHFFRKNIDKFFSK